MARHPRYLLAALLVTALGVLTTACGGGGGGGGTTTGPTPPALTLTALTITPATVAGGAPATVTATLSAAAPAAGAAVALSSNNAAVTVPATVPVAAGATTGTAQVTTSAVTAATNVTLTGTLSASTQTVSLAVEPAPVARFTVVSPTEGTDACRLVGNATPDCTMDGSTSTGSGAIQNWTWTFKVGPDSQTVTTTSPTTQVPSGCTLFSREPASNTGSGPFIQMIVELVVRDQAGRVSVPSVNPNVRVLPRQQCGRGF